MFRIQFLEKLCEKLFEKEQVFQPEEFDYHSITCLCGGAYMKDARQGFKYCIDCGTTDLLLEYKPEYNYENGPYFIANHITLTNDRIT